MDKTIRWGILGPGGIAHKFAKGLKVLPDAALTAVGSRATDRAEAFGAEYGIQNCYGSYEALAADPEVDVVYVASPHVTHHEHVLMCLEAGKAVLCEKPIAVNSQQLEEMIAVSREKNVFLMEAMWTRFLPVMVKVREWLRQDRIGDVRMAKADFGFRIDFDPESRLLDPQLGGGALLDVGVYTISFASMVFGESPVQITGMTHLGETGVDEQSAVVLGYPAGQMALLSCAVRTSTPHDAIILGTRGSIRIPNFWHAEEAVLEEAGKEPLPFKMPLIGNGYNYEAEAVMACLRAGWIESPDMPLDESLSIMKTMDSLRQQWGLRYPME